MRLELKDKVALVTGASMGIGRATALELAGEGCNLAICARGLEKLEEVRDRILEKGVRCLALKCDITSAADITAMMAQIEREYGRLDILVNNAGAARHGAFSRITDEILKEDYETKVLGQVRCTRAAIPLLEKSKAARIINVNAVAGRFVMPGLFATVTHRAACFALNKALAVELAPKGILVNSVNIGFVLTNQMERAHERAGSKQSLEEFAMERARTIPLGRYGTPEEVSGLITFLASDRGSYITGASIDVGGGQGAHI